MQVVLPCELMEWGWIRGDSPNRPTIGDRRYRHREPPSGRSNPLMTKALIDSCSSGACTLAMTVAVYVVFGPRDRPLDCEGAGYCVRLGVPLDSGRRELGVQFTRDGGVFAP